MFEDFFKEKENKIKDLNTNDQYGNNKSTAPKDAFELYTICCADQSRQSHIGTDIQASLLEGQGPQYTRVDCGHQLVVTNSGQEETNQVKAPCWKNKLSPSRQTAAPSPVCHTQICNVLSHLFPFF